MDHPNIKNRLFAIFHKRFHIRIDPEDKEILDKQLLGYDLNLEARDLLYLYKDIKAEFQIHVPESEIINGNFKTINGILQIINSQSAYNNCRVG